MMEILSKNIEKTDSIEKNFSDTKVFNIDKFKEIDNDYYSTYHERKSMLPKNGEWTGEKGEAKFIPSSEAAQEKLAEKGVNGIEYKNAIPDFSSVAEETVTIDNMTSERYGKGGNFEQCDTKCAEKWNSENHLGKNDWTPRDVEAYRKENKLSWHECNDMKTCNLVDQSIHTVCTHIGGCYECKQRDNIGGGFDD